MTTTPFRVLGAHGRDADEWRELCGRLADSKRDFHYLPEYALIYERTYGHPAHLAVLGDDQFVAMPFLLKDIRELNLDVGGVSSTYDVINPYGYGGPIGRGCSQSFSSLHDTFFARFHEYCREIGVVSEFGSFHPMLSNHAALGDRLVARLAVRKRKPVVYLDLRQDEEALWGEVCRGHRSSISRARRLGVQVAREPVAGEALSAFLRIYDGTMDRHQADARWRVPADYFATCAQYLGTERVSLFSAFYNGVRVAQYLIIHYADGVYYHFGGSTAEHFDVRANNLLMYEIALWAKRAGYAWFHLGGGHGRGGGLFQFKSGFSRRTADLYTYSVIHDADAYTRLSDARRAMSDSTWDSDPDFFPAYRR